MASTITRPTMVDDDGTGTTGTILSKSFFDGILDNIDAMFAGGGSYATFSFGGALTSIGAMRATMGGDAIGVSGRASVNTYYLGANYYDANGTDTVVTSGNGSWRTSMRNVTTLEFGIDWRAASAGAGTFTRLLTLSSGGTLTLGAGGLNLPATATVYWTNRGGINRSADGVSYFNNDANTAAFCLRSTTNDRCEVRNSGNTGYGDLYAKEAVFSGGITATGVCRADGGFQNGANVGIDFNGDPNSLSNMHFDGGILIGTA